MTENFADDLMLSLRFHMQSRGRSELTRTQYESAFRRLYTALSTPSEGGLKAVTRADIERYLAELRKVDGGKLARATLRYQFAGLQGFFKWYAEMEGVADPMAGMRGPAVGETDKDIVTLEDVRRVLARLERLGLYRDAAYISLSFEVPCRVSELVRLEWSMVSFPNQEIRLEETKNGDVRVLPFEAATGRRLDILKRKRADKVVPWVFTGRAGRALTRSGALQMVKGHFAASGIPGISPHDLRHSSATAFMDANPDGAQVLKVVGGWRSDTMVNRYAKKGRERRAVDAFRKMTPTSRL